MADEKIEFCLKGYHKDTTTVFSSMHSTLGISIPMSKPKITSVYPLQHVKVTGDGGNNQVVTF